MYSWVGLEKEMRGFSNFTINDSSMMNALKGPLQNGFRQRGHSVTALISSQTSQEYRCWPFPAMLQNRFWQSASGAGNWASSAKQEDGAGTTLFRASIGILMYPNCSFDRCPPAHKKTKKEKEHSLHQKIIIWQSLASRTGNLGQRISSFGEDGVMRGEGVQ